MVSDYHRFLNAAILLWGCIFCLIAALCLFMGKNYNKEKRKWMLRMQLSTALLLGSDMLAWMFSGNSGETGYYIVRISNFLVFALTDLIFLFFQQYIGCYVNEEGQKNKRLELAGFIALAGILLVMISQFTDIYYYFDVKNCYHRNSAYILSMILPLSGMLIDLSVLIQYRKKIRKSILLAMESYIVLPIAAAMIQIIYYGLSLINVSIFCSMLLMFIVTMGEQNKELARLTKSREEIAEKLEIASVLNRCVKELSSGANVDLAVGNLLEIINDYFNSDRTYIFEIDFDRDVLVNTYEYVKDEKVTVQKGNLQCVPVDIIAVWMQKFRESEGYYISDLEQEKGSPTYEMLKEQDVNRLLAVPLLKEGKIIGFLGVDNPRMHYNDATLLASIQFFITSSLERKKEQEYLEYLSYRDMLTQIYNRNKYMEVLDEHKGEQIRQTGVAYIDINGLKMVNDKQGHEAGDELIRQTAAVITEFFPECAYRIGGDEFVIVKEKIDKQEFYDKIKELRKKMQEKGISISAGSVWKESIEDLEETLKIADHCMYAEKEAYHKMNGDYHRA